MNQTEALGIVRSLANGIDPASGEAFPTGSSSQGYFAGEVFITEHEASFPNEDAAAYSLTFEGHGVLTSTSTG